MESVVTVVDAISSLGIRGKRVLVTGHTGFKGTWLSEWLLQMGAKVSGIALPPESPDALFNSLRHAERLDQHICCDIRDSEGLKAAIERIEPELIFHLAAQALVRRSYREPLLTWETNVLGTLNVLQGARALTQPVTVVAVTTDKVYKNREWEYQYREEDELGGHDPYSASKAACELAVASWRASYGAPEGVTVVTARAGNVIGGGDYSEDRLVPDCFRAWERNEQVQLRNPGAVRPWQHVLEPLSGYLLLAARARTGGEPVNACNFGPEASDHKTVVQLVQTLAEMDSRRAWSLQQSDSNLHEARALSLSIERARLKLGWSPRLSFHQALQWTNAAYSAPKSDLPALIERQIAEYTGLSPSVPPTP